MAQLINEYVTFGVFRQLAACFLMYVLQEWPFRDIKSLFQALEQLLRLSVDEV